MPLAEALGRYVPAQVWEPGTAASYSNWATSLAGLVVANVSGMSYEDYIDEHIFTPLNMRNSTFREPLPERLEVNMSTGYFSEGRGLEVLGYEFISNFGPAGAIASTATDMANFMIAHVQDGEFRGQRILQAETAQLMHSELFRHHPDVTAMAHGFYEVERNGHRLVSHGGDTIAFHSDLVIDPVNDFGFYISFNATEGAPARAAIVNAVLDYYYPAAEAAAPAAAEVLDGAGERLAKVAGVYRMNRRSYTKLESIAGIIGDVSIVPEGENRIIVPAPFIGGVFEEIESYQYRKVNGQARIVFETDQSGEVTRALLVQLPMMSLTKLTWYQSGTNHIVAIALALLASLFVIINTFRNWSANRATEGLAKRATWSAFAVSVANIVFAVAFAALFAKRRNARDTVRFPAVGNGRRAGAADHQWPPDPGACRARHHVVAQPGLESGKTDSLYLRRVGKRTVCARAQLLERARLEILLTRCPNGLRLPCTSLNSVRKNETEQSGSGNCDAKLRRRYRREADQLSVRGGWARGTGRRSGRPPGCANSQCTPGIAGLRNRSTRLHAYRAG